MNVLNLGPHRHEQSLTAATVLSAATGTLASTRRMLRACLQLIQMYLMVNLRLRVNSNLPKVLH